MNSQSDWAGLEDGLPADLAGKRVLDVGRGPDRISEQIASRGPAEVVPWDPSGSEAPAAGPFDVVVCRGVLQLTPHPANLLSRLWAATAEGSTLLFESTVLTGVEDSRFARFVDASAGVGETEWLPGRLAFRWSVETSGFDVERWLPSPGLGPGAGEASVYLVATRTARPPSLDIAIPVAPE